MSTRPEISPHADLGRCVRTVSYATYVRRIRSMVDGWIDLQAGHAGSACVCVLWISKTINQLREIRRLTGDGSRFSHYP